MAKKDIINLIITLVAVAILIYFFSFSKSQKRLYSKLDSAGIIDTAVIIREFVGAKRKLYFEYIFEVKGEKHNGFLQYSPSNGFVSIGDSFLVKYLPDNPDEINRLVEREDYSLIKVSLVVRSLQ